MGRVYLARDGRLGRMVALKEAVRDGTLAERLVLEARVTAGLEHPGIVPIYDEGRTEDGRPYYTMRLLRGRPLSQVLDETPLGPSRQSILRHFLDACEAMAYAHSRGVIHRDLKPANIMIGEFGELQVVDWGLARSLDGPAPAAGDTTVGLSPVTTRDGAVIGTPAYMSPEQARGEPADRRSDVWGLGAVLYEIVAGVPPLGKRTSDGALEAAREGRVVPLLTVAPETPPALAAIVNRALAPEPADRYPDAAALAEDVAAWVDGRRVEAHTYSRWELWLRFYRAWRAPLLVAGAAATVIAALVVGGTLSLRRERDRALAAEDEARVALRASDENLADALVAQARTAQAAGSDAAAEVLAARALGIRDTPEARGIVAAARAAGRPTRVATAATPVCSSRVTLAVDDTVCAERDVVWRVVGGVERWRTPAAVETLAVQDGLVVALLGEGVTVLDLETGRPAPGPWTPVQGTVGQAAALPMSPPAAPAWAVRTFASVCGDVGGLGVSVSGRSYTILCQDGRIARGEIGGAAPIRAALARADFTDFSHLVYREAAGLAVVAGTSGRVAVADLASGQVWSHASARPEVVRRLAVSPRGDRLAVDHERGGIEVYSLPELALLASLPAVQLRGLTLDDAGEIVATGATRTTAWSIGDRLRTTVLPADAGLSGVAFSPDGATLVSSHGDGRVVAWDVRTGMRRYAVQAGFGVVKGAVAFAGDSTRFYTVDVGAARVEYRAPAFATADGAEVWSVPAAARTTWQKDAGIWEPGMLPAFTARRVVWVRPGRLLYASYVPGMPAYDLDRGVARMGGCPRREWMDLATSPGGELAAAVARTGEVYTLDADLRCRPIPAPRSSGAADVSADGAVVVVGADQALVSTGPAGIRWAIGHPAPFPLDVSLSPDGRWVATAGPDADARVWDARDGRLRAVLGGHEERVASVDFSPDGALLATASWDHTARLWDLTTLDLPAETLAREAEATWGLSLQDVLAP